MGDSTEPERCPNCGRPMAWWKDEAPCSPIRSPDCWRITGMSRNGSPILRVVDDD